MIQILLMMLLLLPGQSIESESKVKLRMEIIAAVTFVGKVNETELRNGLVLFTEKFEIDQRYTRMALLDYDHTIIRRTSLTDNRDKLVSTIMAISNRAEEHRSYLYKALQEMLEISRDKGRKKALKLFVVITHKWPTVGDGVNYTYEYDKALPVSKAIKANGMFYIVYSYAPNPEVKVTEYFSQLCGEQNLITLNTLGDLQKAIEYKIFPEILIRACERRERVCYFIKDNLESCQAVWHFPDGYLTNEECRKWRGDNSPDVCNESECHQHCDRYWPWEVETSSCDCNVGNTRRGDLPLPDLQHCPRVKQCSGCKYPVRTKAVDVHLTGKAAIAVTMKVWEETFPTWWQVLLLIFIVSVAIGVIAFAIMMLLSRNSTASSNLLKRSLPDARVKKAKSSLKRSIRTLKLQCKIGPVKKKR